MPLDEMNRNKPACQNDIPLLLIKLCTYIKGTLFQVKLPLSFMDFFVLLVVVVVCYHSSADWNPLLPVELPAISSRMRFEYCHPP